MIAPLTLANLVLLVVCRRAARDYKDFFASELFLKLAFTRGECLVNAYSAAFMLLAPSFTAHELAPHFPPSDPAFAHPALRLCVRLFGATEILVAGMFFFVLNKDNAKTFLPVVLMGDLAHYIAYARFSTEFPAPSLLQHPGVVAHLVTMTAVLHTKVLYLSAASLS